MTTCNRIALLVTGSRGWQDTDAIRKRLEAHNLCVHGGIVLIHGYAEGADTIAHRIGTELRWRVESTPYFDWLGKRGGHVRNAMMLDKLRVYRKYEYTCFVEAFSLGTPGTEGMIRLATAAGFSVNVTRGEKT